MDGKEAFCAQVGKGTEKCNQGDGLAGMPGEGRELRGQQPGPRRTLGRQWAHGPTVRSWWSSLPWTQHPVSPPVLSSAGLLGLPGKAGGSGGHAGEGGCKVTPFLLRIGSSPSLSHCSLWTVIFSSRYFPQANFSVTSHPLLSISGCYIPPARCLLLQTSPPSAFPHTPSLSGTAGPELSATLRMASRQELAANGLSKAGLLRWDLGKLSQHRQGDSALESGGRSWKSPGSTPALLPVASREKRGRLKAPEVCRCFQLP